MYYFFALLLMPLFIVTIYLLYPMNYVLNAIYLVSFYSILVPSLFFTYGSYIERKSLELQIDRVMDIFTKVIHGLNIIIPDISVPADGSNDDIDSQNRKIIEEAFLVMGIVFAVGVTSGLLLYYKFKNKYKLNLYKILRNTLIVLLVIIIVELIYFGLIVKNYRTLSTNEIISVIAKEILDKL